MKASPWFFGALAVTFCGGIILLIAELFRLQMIDVADANQSHDRQSARTIRISGERGRILDRRGRVLADSQIRRDAICLPEEFLQRGPMTNTVHAILNALKPIAAAIGRPPCVTRNDVLNHLRRRSAQPLVVWQDLSDPELARFSESAIGQPGLDTISRTERHYPYGSLAAHALGYAGSDVRAEGDETEERFNFHDKDTVGREGLERYYDRYLAGVPGIRRVRVDARGFRPNARRSTALNVGTDSDRAASRGPDLTLELDVDVQIALERVLAGRPGAGVVLDPRDGAVRAIASFPTFDLTLCSPTFPKAYFAELVNDPRHPLLNRAIGGLYPPGSTFKPIAALAALAAGTPAAGIFECTGSYEGAQPPVHCWDRYGHGDVDLVRALEQSCNTYFADLGVKVGTNALFAAARAFGFEARTGVDLPGERAGSLIGSAPTDASRAAIGQDAVLATPLLMASVCAALANGGKVFAPRLRSRAEGEAPNAPIRHLPFTAQQLADVRTGMRLVVERGTGRRVRTRYAENRRKFDLPVSCAAKTGTAQRGHGRKDTWVIAFAPFENPEWALSIVVENGESGGITTAPLAHDVLAALYGETERGRTKR